MDAQLWPQVEELFNQVVDLPPAERDALLASAPPSVRAAVLPMLEVETQAAHMLQASVAETGKSVLASQPKRFGAWRVTGVLGEGGMGAVYKAVRDDNAFEKEVAIKVLHVGGRDSVSRTRFVQERRILALLEHPNIARLIDGGEDDDGNGFIVMEYIDGTNILDYATSNHLDTAARLQLFASVCAAVQYAHRNLVVHRDLKPANIMVDRTGAPKLLDFGIAKLVDSDELRTLTGFQTLTPQYASPEQVRGEPITTASDVYSLGVVLYELLTGRRPYDFATMSPIEIDRVVCQTAPRPSGLPVDLETILAMALRKEPARRYQSVDQLAADCQNYLESRPVSARPDTLRYRARKYVRRNWLPLAAVAAVVLALGTGAAVAIQQARVARTRFEDVRRLAHAFIFDFEDEAAKVNGNTKLRERMVQTAMVYLDQLSRSAGNDQDLLKELGAGYERVGVVQGVPSAPNLGRPADALVSFSRAAVFHERAAKLDPKYGWRLGAFYNNYVTLLRQTGDFDGAERALAVARKHLESALQTQPGDLTLQVNHANTWCMEGDLLEDQSRLPAAWKANRQCLERTRALLEKSQSRQLIVLGAHATERVAGSATSIGRFEEALAAYDEEDRFLAELLKAEPTNPQFRRNVAIVAQGRAGVYCSDDHPSLDQPEPCLRYANQYLEHARQLSAGDAGNLSARTSVAIALSRVSWIQHFLDPATSVRLGRESIKIFDELIAGGNKGWFLATRRARTLRRLVESLLANHQNREALAAANEALAAQRVISARNPKDAAEAGFLVRALLMAAKASDAMRNPAKAGEFFTEAESVASAAWSRNRDDLPTMKQLSDTRLALGDWFRSRQDPARSRDWYVRAAALWREFPDRNAYVAKKTAEVEQLIPKDSLNSN